MSWLGWLGLAVGGAAGAVARLAVDQAVSARLAGALPYGTLAVNLSGSFLLGLIAGAALSGDALATAGTGAIGSYTTFSTWMFESHRLGEEGALAAAGVNVALSIVVGVAAVLAGRALGHAL